MSYDGSSTDISDQRYGGCCLENFLCNHGWYVMDDRGYQGVYYRNNEQYATLTIWWQTGKYRTKLDRDVHPGDENIQMFGPKDPFCGRRVLQDIQEVAKYVRHHTNNRYSDRYIG